MPSPYLAKPSAGPLVPGPASAGLVLACPLFFKGGTVLRDWSGAGRDGTITGGSFGDGARGPVLQRTATTDLVTFSDSSFLPLAAVTVVLLSKKRDATLRPSGALGTDDGTASRRLDAYLGYNDTVVYFDFGASRLTSGSLTMGDDVFVLTAGPRAQEVWQNGVVVASASAPAARSASSTTAFYLGDWALGGGADLTDVGGLLIYDHQLEPGLIRALSADPFLPWRRSQSRQVALLAAASLTTAGGPFPWFTDNALTGGFNPMAL